MAWFMNCLWSMNCLWFIILWYVIQQSNSIRPTINVDVYEDFSRRAAFWSRNQTRLPLWGRTLAAGGGGVSVSSSTRYIKHNHRFIATWHNGIIHSNRPSNNDVTQRGQTGMDGREGGGTCNDSLNKFLWHTNTILVCFWFSNNWAMYWNSNIYIYCSWTDKNIHQ